MWLCKTGKLKFSVFSKDLGKNFFYYFFRFFHQFRHVSNNVPQHNSEEPDLPGRHRSRYHCGWPNNTHGNSGQRLLWVFAGDVWKIWFSRYVFCVKFRWPKEVHIKLNSRLELFLKSSEKLFGLLVSHGRKIKFWWGFEKGTALFIRKYSN